MTTTECTYMKNAYSDRWEWIPVTHVEEIRNAYRAMVAIQGVAQAIGMDRTELNKMVANFANFLSNAK